MSWPLTVFWWRGGRRRTCRKPTKANGRTYKLQGHSHTEIKSPLGREVKHPRKTNTALRVAMTRMTENLLQHTYSKQNPELENYSAVLKRFFVELFHKNIRAKSPRFPQELLVRIWWKFPGTTRISFPSTQPLSVTPWMIASCSHTPHCQSLTINRSAHNKQCWLTSDRRVKTEQGSTGFFFSILSPVIGVRLCAAGQQIPSCSQLDLSHTEQE